MNKKISIIVPCYNVEKWIDRCVRSLVKQTIGLENLELIFVDDASSDGTVERLKRWERRFPESVLIIECEENGRQGTARNIGMKYASAPYIGYVDADDWVEKEMYEELYLPAEENGADVVSCLMGRDTGDGNFINISPYQGVSGKIIYIRDEEERKKFFANGFPGCNCSRLFRKSFLEKTGLRFPEKTAYEDNYFGAVLSFLVTSVYIVDKPMYHYFYNVESTVTTRNSLHQLDRLKIELMILEELEKKGFLEKYREKILDRFLHYYYVNTLHLIFTRFDELPVERMENMKKTVLEKYPEWKNSRNYESLSSMEKGFLQTLEVEMTAEMWGNLKNNYLMAVKRRI